MSHKPYLRSALHQLLKYQTSLQNTPFSSTGKNNHQFLLQHQQEYRLISHSTSKTLRRLTTCCLSRKWRHSAANKCRLIQRIATNLPNVVIKFFMDRNRKPMEPFIETSSWSSYSLHIASDERRTPEQIIKKNAN